MQINNTDPIFNGKNFANSNAKNVSKAEDETSNATTDSGSAQTTEDTMTEEEKLQLKKAKEEEEARQREEEARRWAEFVEEFGYDREDSSRPAIANHGKKYGEAEGVNPDKVYAYNGLDQATEDSIEGIQLDLDKYNDSCGYMLEDTGDKEANEENKQNYLTHVGMYIEKDLADYFGINVNYQTGEGERDLMSVYQQILQNNGIDEYDTSSAAAYNQYARTVLAGLSCDEGAGSFRNDYVCLNNIEVGKISPIVAPDNSNVQVADASETENNKTESGLEKRTVNDDSAAKVLALAASHIGEKAIDGDSIKYFDCTTLKGSAKTSTPWCAAFAYTVLSESGAELQDWYKNIPNQTHCNYIYEGADAHGQLLDNINEAQPGDLIVMDGVYNYEFDEFGNVTYVDGFYGAGGEFNHVAIVESVNPDGSINTIEGNTGDYPGEVARRTRYPGIETDDYGNIVRMYACRVLK